MRICPADLARCNRPQCSTGICELTGEAPFRPCIECGVLIVSALANGFCVECIGVDTIDLHAGG